MWIFWPGIMHANSAGRARSNQEECHWAQWTNISDGQYNQLGGLTGLFAQGDSHVNATSNFEFQDNRDVIGAQVFFKEDAFNKRRGLCWDPEAEVSLGGMWPRATEKFYVEGLYQGFMNPRPTGWGMVRIQTSNNSGAPADFVNWTMIEGDQWDVHQWRPRGVVELVPGGCVNFRIGIFSGTGVIFRQYPSSIVIKQLTNCEEDLD
jgi:hypothetical protein